MINVVNYVSFSLATSIANSLLGNIEQDNCTSVRQYTGNVGLGSLAVLEVGPGIVGEIKVVGSRAVIRVSSDHSVQPILNIPAKITTLVAYYSTGTNLNNYNYVWEGK